MLALVYKPSPFLFSNTFILDDGDIKYVCALDLVDLLVGLASDNI